MRGLITALALVAVMGSGAAQAQGRLSYALGEAAALAPSLNSGSLNALAGSAAATQSRPESLRSPTDAADYPEYPPVVSDNYGQWLFGGHFARQSFTGFNPGYVVGPGDLIDLRFWGGYDFQALLDVDSQGTIFVPRLGPIRVAGIRNADLNDVLKSNLRRVFRDEVGVYAALASAQPVKVFVGGGVVRPGLYGATSSDSLLHFLDRAGGVEPEAGSYRAIKVLRNGREIHKVDLYDFLAHGKMPLLQFHDGDIIFVAPRQSTATVEGLVAWPRRFEFENSIGLGELLQLAQVQAEATHVRVTRIDGPDRRSDVYALADSATAQVPVAGGDQLEIYADRTNATIVVRVKGEHEGSGQVVVPYGATLGQVLEGVAQTPLSDTSQVRLYRKSLAARQKEVIDQLLRKLEESVLTARSKTTQEAALRTQEAQLILQFVERARQIEPKGQVILQEGVPSAELVLEDGDVLEIPRQTHLVGVHGEVYLPAAFSWDKSASVSQYIEMAGGFTQSGARDRVLLMKPNGAVRFARVGAWFGKGRVEAGDEILVLPRVDKKSFQFSKDVVEVIYQIAVAAGVLVRL